MTNKFTARKSIVIKASKDAVWEALTNPELIRKYFFGTETTTTWEKGSPIYFRGEWEGKPYEDKGIVIDSRVGEYMCYSYWSSFSGTADIPENYAMITYELKFVNETTVLNVTQDGLRSKEVADHSEANWEQVLTNLKKMIEE